MFSFSRVSLLLSLLSASLCSASPVVFMTPKSPDAFLKEVHETLSQLEPITIEADWIYNTNLTDHNQQKATEAQLVWNKQYLAFVEESRGYQKHTDLTEKQSRLLKILQMDGSNTPLDPIAQEKLSVIVARMTEVYSTGTVDGKPLSPDLEKIMAGSRDVNELLNAYVGWRNATGPKMKDDYVEFVKLVNQAATEGGFANAKELWLSGYDMPPDEFAELLETIWSSQLLPLYEQLHCYVRSKLTAFYGEDVVGSDGYIPGHLLGNMWSQDWSNIYDLVAPYPNIPSTDVTPELKKQGYNATRMHRLAEDFYTSLGFDPLPSTFWEKSMLEKPTDREVVCHASAWDFGSDDLRIKMCTQITHEDLITVHHEQGHLMYDHYYRNQHYLFRSGAADFFHEAIGDTVALSVVVPDHLAKIGLLPGHKVKEVDDSALINYQMQVALSKISILPWALLVDKWRWAVFDGTVGPDQYNKAWWDLVEKYQGVKSPVQRADDGFDAGSKFHIPNNTPYARYFGAAVLQFQLHSALCKIAKQNGPLHDCSIYKSKEAGESFKELLKLGRSKRWQVALEKVVGKDGGSEAKTEGNHKAHHAMLDASALVEYFAPLAKWLENENSGRQCGWEKYVATT